jgi:type IV secretory pathway TrbD component
MAIFEGVDRNRNIIIAVAAVVVILVIVYWLYAAGHLSGIV